MLQVHKFGGTSVGDAARIDRCCHIIADAHVDGRCVIAVVSAMSGVTNTLLDAIQAVADGDLSGALARVETLRTLHDDTVTALALPDGDAVLAECRRLFDDVTTLLNAASIVGKVGPRARDRVQSTGEKLVVRVVASRLRAIGSAAVAVDADTFLETDAVFGEATPLAGLYERTTRVALLPIVERGDIAVITGFCGCAPDGATTTLGRGGSDYSATLVGAALNADEVVIYTDVDGVYTADPRVVGDARIVEQLNYREAGELAYYGAKVLHPRTLKPVAGKDIPVSIRNSFNVEAPGTWIDGRFTPGSHPVKAISAIRDHSLISVEGSGMAGVPGVAARLFAALAAAQISVTMISQSSSESSICVAVPSTDADAAEVALRREFRLDIAHGDVEDVRRQPDVGLLAVVGLGMAHVSGIAGRVSTTLGAADANILAIAQGSSELNITFALRGDRVDDAMRAVHRELGLHRTDTGDAEARAFDLIVLGWGNIARQVAQQLRDRRDEIEARFGVRGRVVCISDRSGYLLDPRGINDVRLAEVASSKAAGARLVDVEGAREGGLKEALAAAFDYRLIRPVVVDLTDADDSVALFETAFGKHADVVTANKKPLAGSAACYRRLRAAASEHGRILRAEATVGAGLPVVDTLEMLLVTGDSLIEAEGCLSGTLAFVLSEVEQGKRLSEAVEEAVRRGFTEPDPYADLSGIDVARKAIIISRIAGFDVADDQVEIEGLVPESLAGLGEAAFLDALRGHDAALAERVADARARGQALRYVATVTANSITVAPREVPLTHPLGRLTGTDNMIVFRSQRYSSTPLVVQGPGAGTDVTAMGVLGDIVRVVAERS